MIIPMIQMRKLRLREKKGLSKVTQWVSGRGLTPGLTFNWPPWSPLPRCAGTPTPSRLKEPFSCSLCPLFCLRLPHRGSHCAGAAGQGVLLGSAMPSCSSVETNEVWEGGR